MLKTIKMSPTYMRNGLLQFKDNTFRFIPDKMDNQIPSYVPKLSCI